MSTLLNQPVADFEFNATSQLSSRLSAYRGRNVVLYFYPKDNTPGCTNESLQFSAEHDAFTALNTVIFGISKDSLASHEKFKAKYQMPFELISDPDKRICTLFDVIRLKKFLGKSYMGLDRSTFIIDTQGVLRHEWRSVKVKGHVAEVLNTLKTLTA